MPPVFFRPTSPVLSQLQLLDAARSPSPPTLHRLNAQGCRFDLLTDDELLPIMRAAFFDGWTVTDLARVTKRSRFQVSAMLGITKPLADLPPPPLADNPKAIPDDPAKLNPNLPWYWTGKLGNTSNGITYPHTTYLRGVLGSSFTKLSAWDWVFRYHRPNTTPPKRPRCPSCPPSDTTPRRLCMNPHHVAP